MAAATTLDDAAGLASSNLFAKWANDTLSARLASFSLSALAIVPSADRAGNGPLANWCAVMSSFAPTVLPYSQAPDPGLEYGYNTIQTYQTSVEYVYRFCKLASSFSATGAITGPQATALLAAYNTAFA